VRAQGGVAHPPNEGEVGAHFYNLGICPTNAIGTPRPEDLIYQQAVPQSRHGRTTETTANPVGRISEIPGRYVVSITGEILTNIVAQSSKPLLMHDRN